MNTINGLEVSKTIGSTSDYLMYVMGFTEERAENTIKNATILCEKLNRIIALVYSYKLLRHTNHICGSLVDITWDMVLELKEDLLKNHNLAFELHHFNYI